MSKYLIKDKFQLALLLGLLVLAPLAGGQDRKVLLQMQRVRAELESQSNFMSIGRNVYTSSDKGQQQLDIQLI